MYNKTVFEKNNTPYGTYFSEEEEKSQQEIQDAKYSAMNRAGLQQLYSGIGTSGTAGVTGELTEAVVPTVDPRPVYSGGGKTPGQYGQYYTDKYNLTPAEEIPAVLGGETTISGAGTVTDTGEFVEKTTVDTTGYEAITNSVVFKDLIENVMPEAKMTDPDYAAKVAELAITEFEDKYGTDPDWEDLKAQYQGDITTAFNALLGDDGALAQQAKFITEQYAALRGDVKQEGRLARQSLAEQAYLTGRGLAKAEATRGVSGGLGQLGQVQAQMAQGRNTTELNRDITKTLSELTMAETGAQLDISTKRAELTKDMKLANASLVREMDAKMRDYNIQKGTILSQLEAAIREQDYNEYSIELAKYDRINQQNADIIAENQAAFATQVDLINQVFNDLVTQAQGDSDLIAELTQERYDMIDDLGAQAGVTSGTMVSEIYNR